MFFSNCWEFVGNKVEDLLKGLSKRKMNIKEFNKANMILILKGNSSKTSMEFRPINLYKVI